MKRAELDEQLTVRVLSSRPLVYTNAVAPTEDRPPHVRAGSAIAADGDVLYVIQDDASFIARVHGDEVTSIALPHVVDGRRRFEVGLGNKLDKLDLEACVIVGDELWAFGSGSLPVREQVVRYSFTDRRVRIDHERALYEELRDCCGGTLNIEGVVLRGDELWFFHRGNTTAQDVPVLLRVDLATLRVKALDRFDLGSVDGVKIGFTDAAAIDDVIVFLAATEASADAIDDGPILARCIGGIDLRCGDVRIAPLPIAGKPEGIAMRDASHAWITVDPDDPDVPTTLLGVDVSVIKRSK